MRAIHLEVHDGCPGYSRAHRAPCVLKRHTGACQTATGLRFMTAKTCEEVQLSATEREVLRLVALGLTSKEIGRIKGIGKSTVNSQIERAGYKLNAKNRVDLVVRAVLAGALSLKSLTVDGP